VWSKLRENKSCRCYYEPLHERIVQLDLAAVQTEPSLRLSQALRHPIPKKNYFAEYADLLRSSNLGYDPELAYDRYLLEPAQKDERLRNYLDGLISSAKVVGRQAVLCFCRSQMRSAWMKQNFGGLHVAQIRNPADQWISFKVDPYFVTQLVIIALKLRDKHHRAFAHIESFENFAQQVSKRASFASEVVAQYVIEPFIRQRDCLDIFLVIWIASTLQAVACCDFVLDIDLLSTDVGYRGTASRWFDSTGCHLDFSDCSSPTSAEAYVPTSTFERITADAASAIRSTASCLVVTNPETVRNRLALLSPLSQRVLSLVLGSK
jgi:hypothetical protein